MKTKLPLLALLLAAACSGPAGETRKGAKASVAGADECPSLGGALGFADARSGGPIACAAIQISRADGAQLFQGRTDRNGLVPLDPGPGEELTVQLAGYAKVTTVPARPFGPGAPLVELWHDIPAPRLRVLNSDGLAISGTKVRLVRGGDAVYEGQTNPLGALVGVPAQLEGLSAQVDGFVPAPVDAAARLAQLAVAQPAD